MNDMNLDEIYEEEKRKSRNMIISIAVLVAIIIILGAVSVSICSNTERYLYYGNDDYIFALIWVGSGRSEDLYCGNITVDDYEKWCEGDLGTIFVYSPNRKGYGYRISISNITSINNYGSRPDFLPLNFCTG